MTEEYRRKSDDMMVEMAGDIKVILSKLEDHSSWIKDHQKSDDDNFKAINKEIISAKASVKVVGWIGATFVGLLEFVHNFWPFIKEHK